MKAITRPDHNAWDCVPYSLQEVYECFLCLLLTSSKKMQETSLQFIILIRGNLGISPFADVIAKAALSPQLFEDPTCWSSLRLEPLTP